MAEQQELATLASRYAEILDRIQQLQEQADSLKALIMENRAPGEYAAGPLTVKIKKGKRNLDAKAFEKHFPTNSMRTAIRSSRKHCPRSSNWSAKTPCRIA